MNLSRKLNAAIRAISLDRVEQLLKEGARPDSSSCMLAIENNQQDILEVLLKAGADKSALEPYWGRTPMVKALKLRNFEAVRILLGAGSSPNESCVPGPPLLYAAREGLAEGVRLLIEAGADLEQRDCSENTPLIWAATNGHEQVIRLLLEAGANPLSVDTADRTAFDRAVESKQEAAAKLLAPLSAGKKPRAKTPMELLLNAIKNKDKVAFENYVASEADLNGQDRFGWRPLDCAIDVNSLEFARRLIDAGADVNRADAEGTSALDLAVRLERIDMIRLLLSAGARPHSEKPLYTSCLAGNAEMLKLLF